MKTVAILSEPQATGAVSYRAIADSRQSIGRTAGEALDALALALPLADTGTLVVVQNFRPDRYFTGAQQERLHELMRQWRAARSSGTRLPAADQAELDALVDLEIRAASARSADMFRAVQG